MQSKPCVLEMVDGTLCYWKGAHTTKFVISETSSSSIISQRKTWVGNCSQNRAHFSIAISQCCCLSECGTPLEKILKIIELLNTIYPRLLHHTSTIPCQMAPVLSCYLCSPCTGWLPGSGGQVGGRDWWSGGGWTAKQWRLSELQTSSYVFLVASHLPS